MSDWVDLQLSHSLSAVEAPEELWARIEAGRNPVPARPAAAVRWGFPFATAACALLVLSRLASFEVHTPSAQFTVNDPVSVERWLAHETAIPVPLRSATQDRPAVAAVSYEVNGRTGTLLVARNESPSHCQAQNIGVVASSAPARSDAGCKFCHSL